MKLLGGILLALLGFMAQQLWAGQQDHEKRLTIIETQNKSQLTMLEELKKDFKEQGKDIQAIALAVGAVTEPQKKR